jgi:hypothetical protein
MDSGAFTELKDHHRYRHSPAEYAAQINRWAGNGRLLAAVAQDYMCESFILDKTGLTIADHQRLTVERYDELIRHVESAYVMPVLQGYAPADYVRHLRQYGARLALGAWVGVGSVCKRNRRPKEIEHVLVAIKDERPDLQLHGFGIKTTALKSQLVNDLLATVDSLAWSSAARWTKGEESPNDHRVAQKFAEKIAGQAATRDPFNYRMDID